MIFCCRNRFGCRLWSGLVLTSLLVAAVAAQDVGSESEWLAGRIVLDVQRMSAWAQGRAVPRQPVRVNLKQTANSWGLQLHRQGAAIPLTHIWDVAAYARICTAPASPGVGRESLLPSRLLDLRAVTIAVENQAVSEQLRENFRDPLAHEEAALLHAVLVLRENAGRFRDSRFSLARITAHLAFARALRDTEQGSLVGQLAEAVLLIAGGRPAAAMTLIDKLPGPPALPAAWKDTLAAAATRDWRRLVKEDPSLLEILVAARLRLQASDGQANESVILYAAEESYQELTDWHRMLLADPPSRHLVVPALPRAMEKEAAEVAAVWQAYRGGAPAPDYAVRVLNLEPELCVHFDDAGQARVAAVDLGTWSAYWQRHLCHAFTYVFARNVLDRRFSDLRLYPFVVLQHHRTPHGVSRAILNRAVRLCRQQPSAVNALNRLHLTHLLAAAQPGPDPFRPWPISPYPAARLNPLPVLGPVPKVVDLRQQLPDPDQWFRSPTLPGTAYDIAVRDRLLAPAERSAAMARWQAMDPWNSWLGRQQLNSLVGLASLAELDAMCGDLLQYDYQLMRDALPRLRQRPDDYAALLTRMAAIEPAAYLAVAELRLQNREPQAAVDAMGQAMQAGVPSDRVQAYRPWLVEWYRRQDDLAQAQKIARQAAADESYFGMRLYARLVEQSGGEAQKLYEVLHRKFWEKCSLLAYFVRQGRGKNDRRYDQLVLGLLKQILLDPRVPESKRREARQRVEEIIFPGGRQRLPRITARKPPQALVLTAVAAPLEKPPLTKDSLLVAFNGIRVLDLFQYFLCRLETNARLARIHLWHDGRLKSVTVDLSQWDAGVKVLNWDSLPESPLEAVKQRVVLARKQQPDGIAQLDLSGLQLTALPPTVTRLPKLEALDLSYNRLTKLPDEIGNLQRLRYLDLGDNHLVALPRSLSNLSQLEYLSVKDNRLQELPIELGRCRELKTLDAGGNRLRTLPAGIGGLQKLEALNLYQNRIRELPAGFAQLRNVRRLSLQANALRGVPLAIFDLSQLQYLYLGDNLLDLAPPALGRLRALELLDLHRNLLTDLPPELAQCRRLKQLLAGRNRLRVLPAVVPQLASLEQLYLSKNYLESVPADLSRLTALRVMAIDQNRFHTLPIETMTKLAGLRVVYYGGNAIHFEDIRKLTADMPQTTFKDAVHEP